MGEPSKDQKGNFKAHVGAGNDHVLDPIADPLLAIRDDGMNRRIQVMLQHAILAELKLMRQTQVKTIEALVALSKRLDGKKSSSAAVAERALDVLQDRHTTPPAPEHAADDEFVERDGAEETTDQPTTHHEPAPVG